jgi:FkbM family methyltransferase
MNEFFFNTINLATNNIPGNQKLAKDFLSNKTDISRYIIGKNNDSALLISTFKIDGVIDDYSENSSYWNNVPVIKSKDIPLNAIVINCSTSISPITVNKILKVAEVKNILNLNEIIYHSKSIIPQPEFVKQMRNDYNENISEWLKVYDLMSDKESINTLLDVMRFRLTADPKYMDKYRVRIDQQYFEDFMNYDQEVFADIGGFDGDTTEEFCRLYPNYNKVFFFEPSMTNMKAAKKRLEKLENIEYIQKGLSDKIDLLSYSSEKGSASAITEVGSEVLKVSTLDIEVTEPVSFIKMDIEGWELKALDGCRNHIINNKPKLAIAVYHNSEDFYKIPNYILSLNPDYEIYLRHYTEGWSETVMYFIPKRVDKLP